MDTEKKFPDYADMVKFDHLAWASNSVLEYAKFYHKLATEFGEDAVMDAMQQYYSGAAW